MKFHADNCYYVAKSGNLDAVKFIITTFDSYHKESLYLGAIYSVNMELIKYVKERYKISYGLKIGAIARANNMELFLSAINVIKKDKYNEMLMYAFIFNRPYMIEKLIEIGADKIVLEYCQLIKDNSQMVPIEIVLNLSKHAYLAIIASVYGNIKWVDMLINHRSEQLYLKVPIEYNQIAVVKKYSHCSHHDNRTIVAAYKTNNIEIINVITLHTLDSYYV